MNSIKNLFFCDMSPERYAELCPEGFCTITCLPIGKVAIAVLILGAVIVWISSLRNKKILEASEE